MGIAITNQMIEVSYDNAKRYIINKSNLVKPLMQLLQPQGWDVAQHLPMFMTLVK